MSSMGNPNEINFTMTMEASAEVTKAADRVSEETQEEQS